MEDNLKSLSSSSASSTTSVNDPVIDLLKNGNGTNGKVSSDVENHCSSNNEHLSKPRGSKEFNGKTEWVRLNIGGQYFVTTKTTLCKNAQSFFYKLLQDDPSIGLTTDKDERGAFLIDRDPQYFAPILNYLRHGKLIIEKNLHEEGVLEEAEFYNIPDLISLIKERIKERDQIKNSQVFKKRLFI